MKLSKLMMTTLLVLSVSACGWMEADSAPVPAATGAQDATNNAVDEPSANDPDDQGDTPVDTPTTPAENNASTDAPEEPALEEGRYFYSEPTSGRCADGTARCDTAPGALPPSPAARLSSMALSDPVADCDDLDEYFGTGDGVACAFARLGPAIRQPLEADDFKTDFVYELYQDGAEWGLAVLEVGPEGQVTPNSLATDSARSLWGFDDVTVEGERITATNGDVLIRTDYWGFPIEMVIRDATFEGTVTTQGDSVVLESGELGGHFEVLDLFGNLNQQASACSDRVAEPFTDDSSTFAECPDFSRHSDAACRGFDLFCPLFSPFAIMADVDLNDDELPDAFSVRLDLDFQQGERRF